MSRLLTGAWLTLGARSAAVVLGLGTSIVVARSLGPEGKGVYALVVLVAALLQTFGILGLDTATVYQTARERGAARRIARRTGTAAAGLGLLLVLLYGLASLVPVVRTLFVRAEVDPALVWILVALLPLSMASLVLTGVLLGVERYGPYNLASLATPTATLALLLVVLVGLGGGVGAAVLATAGGTLAGFGATLLLVRSLPPPPPGGEGGGNLGEALSFGWRAHLSNLAWFLHYRLDMFLVGYMGGPAALGFYATSVGLAEKLYLVPSVIGTLVFPRVAAGGEAGSRNLTPRASRQSLWITLVLAAVLALVARPVILLLYGRDFLPAVTPLLALLPGVVALAVGRVLSGDLTGRGHPGLVGVVNGAMAAVNVALNLWWIPLWGPTGAALATSVSYSVAVLILAAIYTRRAGVRAGELLGFTARDAADLRAALRVLLRPGTGGSP